jgi:hypothetical protein
MLMVLVLLPAFFTYMRLRSGYPVGSRYFTPFFGLGLVSLVFFLEVAHAFLQRVLRIVQARTAWVPGAVTFVMACILFVAVGGSMLVLGARDVTALQLPPRNFSPYYRVYEELKDETTPLFVLHDHHWAADIAEFYIGKIGRPCPVPWAQYCSTGTYNSQQDALSLLKQFLVKHPDGVVVLDRSPLGLAPEVARIRRPEDRSIIPSRLASLRLEPGVVVEEACGGPCYLWKVRGARTADQVALVAAAVELNGWEGVFGR